MATMETRIRDLATRIGTQCKALGVLINGNVADLSALTTTAKNNLVAAINEVRALALAGGSSVINDGSTGTSSAWSSSKTDSEITARVNAVLGAATPTTLDTLKEIASALGDDSNFAATMTAALGKRVRVDAAQTFTAPEKAQARSNIGADITSAEIGNPDTDFVAVFNTAVA